MASPATPRMIGRWFGKNTICLKASEKKNGPHRLYWCWNDNGSDRGQLILVQGNTLRGRGYKGGTIRRQA